MRVLPHTRSCFVCGESNSIGLNLRFETDERLVTVRFVPRPEHAGFKQTVHGGLLATVLDEMMVWVCGVQSGRFAYCAELSVRFLHPARPGAEITGTAELTNNRRNKLFEARAELTNSQGIVLARGSGKYLPIKEADAAAMLDDFVGNCVSGEPRTVLARQSENNLLHFHI